MMMENFLYPNHPVRWMITGPGECEKSVFLTNLFLNFINEFDKIYIYSPSLHQESYHKIIESFSNSEPFHTIPNILNEQDINVVIEEIVFNKEFKKSGTGIEAYESIEEIKFPQEYEDVSIIILDDLNEEETKDPRV